MSGYTIAWLVIGLCGLGCAAGLYNLLRSSPRLLRHLVTGCSLGFFLLPAPVPEYEGYIAPAFVVAIFEMFMQLEGKPVVALRVLGLGMVVIGGLILLFHYVSARRKSTVAAE